MSTKAKRIYIVKSILYKLFDWGYLLNISKVFGTSLYFQVSTPYVNALQRKELKRKVLYTTPENTYRWCDYSYRLRNKRMKILGKYISILCSTAGGFVSRSLIGAVAIGRNIIKLIALYLCVQNQFIEEANSKICITSLLRCGCGGGSAVFR